MSNDIRHVLDRAYSDVPEAPPEAVVHARARRRERRRMLGGSSALAGLLVVGVLAVRPTSGPRVSTNGLASAPSAPGNPVDGAVTGQAPTSGDRATGSSTGGPGAVAPGVTTLPAVTVPGQSPPPQHTFTAPPTGTRLYFLSGGDLVSTRIDGTGRVVVLRGYFGVPLDVWPDGSKLLMSTTQGGGADLVVLDLRTGHKRTVVHRDRNDMAGAALSPDGTRIAYAVPNNRLQTFATGYTSAHDVHIVNVDGSADRVLVTGDAPVWAPDGGRLLVQACGDDGSGRPCTIRPDGSGRQMLDSFPYAGPVSWSPDGTWLAGRDGDGRLSIARLDGSGLRTIGKAMGASPPAWTPDGSRIVYQREPEGLDRHTGACNSPCDGTYGLSSAAVNGGGDVRLTTAQNDGHPVIG